MAKVECLQETGKLLPYLRGSGELYQILALRFEHKDKTSLRTCSDKYFLKPALILLFLRSIFLI